MKKTIKLRANAKINLGLNVYPPREDGYHPLDMLMLPIALYDELRIELYEEEGKLTIYTRDRKIPKDQRNIIWKVYEAFYQHTKIKSRRMKVFLKKNIPSEAGLGGGSADGAFFLQFLNRLHKYPLSLQELESLALTIGADLPFFLTNKKARVQGIGEKITHFTASIPWKVLLMKPSFGCSTKEVYQWSDLLEKKQYSDLENITSTLQLGQYKNLEGHIFNTLEQAIFAHENRLQQFKKEIEKLTGRRAFLSGSGSCYCILVSPKEGQKLRRKCQKYLKDCQIKLCGFL